MRPHTQHTPPPITPLSQFPLGNLILAPFALTDDFRRRPHTGVIASLSGWGATVSVEEFVYSQTNSFPPNSNAQSAGFIASFALVLPPTLTSKSMLAFFPRISTDDAISQSHRTLQQMSAQHAVESAARVQESLLRRGPGRPKLELNAHDVLAAATASSADAVEASSNKRGKYNNWWASHFIHDILAAHRRSLGNADETVRTLQRSFPRPPTETAGRFESLATENAGKLSPSVSRLTQTSSILQQRATRTQMRMACDCSVFREPIIQLIKQFAKPLGN